MLPHLSQVVVVKGIQCGEVANGILNPVWARNLKKEFIPVYSGYKEIFVSRERINTISSLILKALSDDSISDED